MKKVVFLALSIIMIGCKSNNKSEKYSIKIEYDYQDVENLHIKWKDCLSQIENNYYVYIYSETCGHCKEVKPYILKEAIEGMNRIYFISYTNEIPIITNEENLVGASDYTNLGIRGTPTLFEIEEGMLSSCYTGSSLIIETLTNMYNE